MFQVILGARVNMLRDESTAFADLTLPFPSRPATARR